MATTAETRERLDRVQAELSSRRSTTYFARGAIAILAGMIVAGASAKLAYDAINQGGLVIAAGVATLAGLMALYAVTQYLQGKKALKGELIRLEELKALRRELQVDDPPALLPNR